MHPISIQTADGAAPAFVFEPADAAPHPGVLLFMDGIGMRPALYPIAQRIADHGYIVLLPDVFWRAGPYTAPDPKALFGDPAVGRAWFGKHMATSTQPLVMRDTAAYLDALEAHPRVIRGKLGVTGYCMGGRLALAAAGTYPDRIAAAGSFHGGGLATDDPHSPHLLAGAVRARVYVAGAIEDPFFDDAQKQRLTEAYAQAGVAATIETYPARHGWVPSDTPVHDAACAERHFDATFALLDGALP